MILIINNKEFNLSEIEGFNKIIVDTWKQNPTISAKYLEQNPIIKTEDSPSYITYKKQNDNTNISYQKALTTKSGIEIHFNINNMGIITNGYIDFYTIKQSTTKRNGRYRLDFNQDNFELYKDLSRKCHFRYPISRYKIDGDLTPGRLTAIISQAINTISKYAKDHNRPSIIKNLSSLTTIEGILYLELCLIDKIKEVIEFGNLGEKEINELNSFLQAYEETQNKQAKRIKEKKEASTNN